MRHALFNVASRLGQGVLLGASAIFAILHTGVEAQAIVASSSLIWGALALHTRSIRPATISHAMHNLAVGLLL